MATGDQSRRPPPAVRGERRDERVDEVGDHDQHQHDTTADSDRARTGGGHGDGVHCRPAGAGMVARCKPLRAVRTTSASSAVWFDTTWRQGPMSLRRRPVTVRVHSVPAPHCPLGELSRSGRQCRIRASKSLATANRVDVLATIRRMTIRIGLVAASRIAQTAVVDPVSDVEGVELTRGRRPRPGSSSGGGGQMGPRSRVRLVGRAGRVRPRRRGVHRFARQLSPRIGDRGDRGRQARAVRKAVRGERRRRPADRRLSPR